MIVRRRLLLAVPLALAASACVPPERVVPPLEHPDGSCRLCEAGRDRRASVVRVRTPLGSGTGTVVDPRGSILTNAHVVRGHSTMLVETHEGELVPARLLRQDPDEDLALLQADGPWILWRPIPLAAVTPPAGDFLTVIGYPREEGWRVDHGLSLGAVEAGEEAELSFLKCDVEIYPGSSGGPLLDARGHLVGLVTGRLVDQPDGPSFARPVSALRAFLEESP